MTEQNKANDILDALASSGLHFKSNEELIKSFKEKEDTINDLKLSTQKVLEQNTKTQEQMQTLLEAIIKGKTSQEEEYSEANATNNTNNTNTIPQNVLTTDNLDSYIEQREQRKQEEARKVKETAKQMFNEAFGEQTEALTTRFASSIQGMNVQQAIAFIKGATLNAPSTGQFLPDREENTTTSKFGKITQKTDRELRKSNPRVANSVEYINAMEKAITDGSYYVNN